MDKEDTVHMYNGILLSHAKEQTWVIYSDMDEPIFRHTEWSKSKEKNKYCILMHIYGIQKNSSDEPIGQE